MKKVYLLPVGFFLCIQLATSQLLPGITVAGGNGRGSAVNQLDEPSGVFVDSQGNIYIADDRNSRVQKWAPGATSGITVAGGNGSGPGANQLFGASDVFVDATGNIYVSDQINSRIQKWAPGASSGVTVAGGNGAGSAANQLSAPYGLFVDASENIYIVDYFNSRVQKWASGGSSGVTVAGGSGFGSAANQLAYPYDVFVDAAGNVYVTDLFNNRVQKWAPGATSGITVAGGNGNGSGANQLHFPQGFFIDAGGNIYVADQYNHRIQKFSVPDIPVCSPNLIVTVPSCNDKGTITWTKPQDTFPGTIEIPEQLDPTKGTLSYTGVLNGHGYYRSDKNYLWPAARDITRLIGGTGVNGHLVTLTSASENNFIFNQVRNSGYAPWIGLFNTGRPGRFRWVSGENLNYTNWGAGEPNNAGGNTKNVTEPYVRLIDSNGAWNDQRSDYAPFIAEFEKPLIRYQQISGPKNGSNHKVGTYTVCYERTNLITDKKDTCCFTVTITCNTALADNAIPSPATTESLRQDIGIGKGLQVVTSPNPSNSFFRLQVSGGDNLESVSIKISDVTGRIIESRNKMAANQTLDIGRNLKPGVYFVQIIQGTRKVVEKLIKQ